MQDLAISEKLCLLKLNLRSFVRKFVFRLSKALGIFTFYFLIFVVESSFLDPGVLFFC